MKRRDLTDIFANDRRLPAGRVWLAVFRNEDDYLDVIERADERALERHGLRVTRTP